MKNRVVLGCFLILAFTTEVDAQDCIKGQYGNVVCGKGQCATDQYGKVLCAREGGGAIRDRYGVVKCGVGLCATDDEGQVKCSTQPGGGAAMDSNGKVKCLGACQDGTEQDAVNLHARGSGSFNMAGYRCGERNYDALGVCRT